jgi:hypothetical protein
VRDNNRVGGGFHGNRIWQFGRALSYCYLVDRDREKKVGGVVRDTTVLEGGVIET